MSEAQRWMCAFLLAGSWVLGESVEASATKGVADSLFQAALAQVGRVPAKESLKAFERVLKVDWNYAPAHFEIAKLYISLNTPVDRQHARYALEEALYLDPENVTYQLMLGDLMRAQGFLWGGGEHYEKVWKTHPEDAKAAYKAGYYCLDEFMRYKDTKSHKSFAEKDFKKAIFYLKRSIELDPHFRDAYYRLGVVYIESRQPKALIRLAEQLLKQYPGDKDALLFCGLGYQIAGVYRKADEFYTGALKQMGHKEREVMESVDLLQGKDEQSRAFQVALQSLREDSSQTWYDSPELDRFWQKQDPLFLSTFNERRMEHYSRVAYANLRFSRPSRGISGWQTDMGKSWIKFGRYIHRVRSLDDRSETWFYESFSIGFKSDGIDIETWTFGGGLGTSSGETEVPRVADIEEAISGFFRAPERHIWLSTPPKLPREVFKDTPPRYVDPYRSKKYTLPHQIAAFQEGDSVRVELAYAIPKNRLKASGPEGVANLVDGIFVFDADWKEVYRKPDTFVKLKWPASDPQEGAGTDSLRRNHLISYSTIYVRPGSYHVAVEVLDQGAGSIGTFRDLQTFSFSDSVLSVSDLLLASRIESRNPSSERREDLKIVPNPLRTFRRSESVSVYFEVYNLMQDASGRTEYDVSYRIGRPEKKEVDPALFAALDLPEAQGRVEVERVVREEPDDPERIWERSGGPVEYRVRYVLPERNRISDQIEKIERGGRGTEIAVTVRYAGERRDDFAYLQVDVGQMPGGVYRLTVAVRDARTGRTAEQEALFRVVE